VRDPPAKTYEAEMNQRVVVIEFESVAQATAAYDSAEYQSALTVRRSAATPIGTYASSKGSLKGRRRVAVCLSERIPGQV
jgi:hypothetical protein